VRFITLAVSSRINHDQAVSCPERSDIATLEPIFDALRDPMLKNQGRAGSFDLIVDSNPVIVRVWHFLLPLV
jgi:hypothetical protein